LFQRLLTGVVAPLWLLVNLAVFWLVMWLRHKHKLKQRGAGPGAEPVPVPVAPAAEGEADPSVFQPRVRVRSPAS
jgi:hypothetical protein